MCDQCYFSGEGVCVCTVVRTTQKRKKGKEGTGCYHYSNANIAVLFSDVLSIRHNRNLVVGGSVPIILDRIYSSIG